MQSVAVMTKNLVIVESPAKAKTIGGFLGNDFIVRSCMGHVADLSKKDLGVDVENGFVPKYIVSPEKKKIVGELKKLAQDSEMSGWLPMKTAKVKLLPGTSWKHLD